MCCWKQKHYDLNENSIVCRTVVVVLANELSAMCMVWRWSQPFKGNMCSAFQIQMGSKQRGTERARQHIKSEICEITCCVCFFIYVSI